jgi:hypothetical protein
MTLWVETKTRLPQAGQLIVKRWANGNVWAGRYSGRPKDSSFDSWMPLEVTFSDCVQAFGDTEGDPYIIAARDQYQRDGAIEIDTPAVVSRGADPGAYVMAWLWVDNATAGLPHDMSSATLGEGTDA